MLQLNNETKFSLGGNMKKVSLLIIALTLCLASALCLNSCNAPGNSGDSGHTHNFNVESAEEDYLKSAATCKSKAVYYMSCSCGKKGEETFEYGAVGTHIFDVESTDEKYLYRPATCTASAQYSYSCVFCGTKGGNIFHYGEFAPHTYNGGCICSVCEHQKSSPGLIIESSGDPAVLGVVGYTDEITEDVYIGDGIEGVMGLGDCNTIKRVFLSDSVKYVSSNAFAGCENLESIYFGKDLVEIQDGAFRGCDKLNEISISEDNEFFFESGNCLIKRDYSQSEIAINVLVLGCKSSVIPSDANIEIITEEAFAGRPGITSITIPDSVKEIVRNAFDGCTDLREVTLGRGIKILDEFAFRNCTALEVINYNIEDLYGYNSNLTFVGAGTASGGITLKIGKNVQSIPMDLFANGSVLDEPNNAPKIVGVIFEKDCEIEKIDLRLFYNAHYLTSIVIPGAVTEICDDAFGGCDNLTRVYYEGTASDFIEIGIGIGNEDFNTAARYYYSKSEPAVSGNFWHYVNGVPTAW